MTETIITEDGQIKVEQTQQTPAPIKIGLAHMLKQIMHQMDIADITLNEKQDQIDRICSQLTDEQWSVLATTQIQLIAVRSVDAAAYLLRK